MGSSSSSRRAPRTQNLELTEDFSNFSQCCGKSGHAHNLQRCCERLDYAFCQYLLSKSGPPNMVIESGTKYKIWSLMSTQKDQYANMTDATNGTSFIVNANGAATDDSTILVMHRIKPESELRLNISFESNGDYYLGAGMGTTHQVEAVEIGDNGEKPIWGIYQMDYPNDGYFAIGFIQPKETNAKLFLSSDGEGIMKLKQPNTPHFGPPKKNHYIDPALLFRLVEP